MMQIRPKTDFRGRFVSGPSGFRSELQERIDRTPLVDSHEHLPDEAVRLREPKTWTHLFRFYLCDDLVSAGMDFDSVFRPGCENIEPQKLWRKIEPFWQAVKHTGYARATRLAIRELYGIEEVDETTVPHLQEAVEKSITFGFYERFLKKHANIESCQVDASPLGLSPFAETRQPALLLQDINILDFQYLAKVEEISKRVGTTVENLDDWHETIRRFFNKYGPYAVSVKSQIAYARGLDFEKVSAKTVEQVFRKKLRGEPRTEEDEKKLQNHLFWFCVEQANEHRLPVKLHTGYYVGTNGMVLSRIEKNPAQLAELCRRSPETRWVFMHLCYPYCDELIAIAKHFSNAFIQSCWSWIINPIATGNFFKRFLVTAPANKCLVFGGDYWPVECVVGHAKIARDGLCSVLYELLEEGYVNKNEVLNLVEPLLRGNARQIFQLEKKYEMAKNVPWNTDE